MNLVRSRIGKISLILVAVLMLFMLGNPKAVQAEGEQEINVVLSDFNVRAQNEGESIRQTNKVAMSFNWDASEYGNTIHAGDYFVVTLSPSIDFKGVNESNLSFPMNNTDGDNIANAVIDPETNEMTVTFTSDVENRNDVKGTASFVGTVSQDNTTGNQNNPFSATCGTSVSSMDAMVLPVDNWTPDEDDFLMWKGGSLVTWDNSIPNASQAFWAVRIYNQGDGDHTLHNVVVTDTLFGTDAEYIEESFELEKVVYEGQQDTNPVSQDISGMLTIDNEKKTFTLNLGTIEGSYLLKYRTTFDNSLLSNKVVNNVVLTTEEHNPLEATKTVSAVEIGGSADGNRRYTLTIKKVDSETGDPLPGATFRVAQNGETSFEEVTTDENGVAELSLLNLREYIVTESSAPEGYDISDEAASGISVIVKNDNAQVTVKNSRTPSDDSDDNDSDEDNNDDSDPSIDNNDDSNNDTDDVDAEDDSDSEATETNSTPDTGDNENIAFWWMLLAVSAVTAFVVRAKNRN